MPCPFGFAGAEDADDEGDMTSEEDKSEEEEAKAESSDQNKKEEEEKPEAGDGAAIKKKKKKVDPEDLTFDFEKDPVSWFYQNQIKSEAEFNKKKDALRAEARKRLDQIMSKKDKKVEWPTDSELDELSIRSSELSDLDSDVDSLGSILSCANSWIDDARYGAPAEKTLVLSSYASLATAAFSMYLSMQAVNTTRKVVGVLVNSIWPLAAFLSCVLLGGAFIGALLSVRYRSRRMLLLSQAAMLLLYSGFLVVMCGVVMRPTVVDPKLRDVACIKYGKSDQGSRLCKMIPGIERDLAEQMTSLMWAGGVAATCSLVCLVTSIWYLYELSYIEKKAIKHKRRHKRRKHSIPWDKIKIVGPVSRCGAGGGGSCPVAHNGGGGAAPAAAAAGAKCPFSGSAGDKKNN
ncbi:hypothetical protein Agub_g3840 [Astrephomene gubernaculifera]|uniref:Transmembrane protein n=1 Tax=Astrephomene gubernaculifera TaxID=47775 RepID=A0AAD3HJK2_9CHLO|nr:hypothetical protein Agub_g3840 [Astrephomene gubernaculifera]